LEEDTTFEEDDIQKAAKGGKHKFIRTQKIEFKDKEAVGAIGDHRQAALDL
jgi:hypothetical protein